MENFYITIENEEDKIEELINLTKKSADPIILERIEKHRDNFNFLKRSIIPLRDSLYEIKSIKDDNVFNVIELENFSFFARLHQKNDRAGSPAPSPHGYIGSGRHAPVPGAVWQRRDKSDRHRQCRKAQPGHH